MVHQAPCGGFRISIHALREEGDAALDHALAGAIQFLSTPSARRATFLGPTSICDIGDFYPRPPRGGRPERFGHQRNGHRISIHALREEGDAMPSSLSLRAAVFLSTPSARRATEMPALPEDVLYISIHALREEGDTFAGYTSCNSISISIHALREEGDHGAFSYLRSPL